MFDRLRTLGRRGAGFIGIALAVLVVGVAVAIVLVQVTADVTSDEFIPTTTTTSTTTTTPSNGLAVALGTAPTSCGSFGLGPLTFSGFTFALNSGEVSPDQYLCVQNQGGAPISSITFAPAVSSSGEDGCSAAEEAVDPDGAGCGSNGELAGILNFSLTRTFSNVNAGSSCIPYPAGIQVSPGGSVALLESPLSTGGLCIYQVDLVFSGTPTDDQKLAASTDTATFTIDVTASP